MLEAWSLFSRELARLPTGARATSLSWLWLSQPNPEKPAYPYKQLSREMLKTTLYKSVVESLYLVIPEK